MNIKQDSRLRGNDGISYFSGSLLGFYKGFRLVQKLENEQ